MAISNDPHSDTAKAASNERGQTRTKRRRLLIVDDEDDLRFWVGVIFDDLGWRVDEATDGNSALVKLSQYQYDLVLLDHRMPGLSGGEVYDQLRATGNQVPVVLITAATKAADIAAEHGISNYLGKPFGIDDLLEIVAATTRHA